MYLSESLVWALEYEDISGVKVFCDVSAKKKVAKKFMEEFNSGWEKAQEAVEEEVGDCERRYTPAETKITEYGFFIAVSPLEVRYCYGDYYDSSRGRDAFVKALENMVTEFTDIKYEGYIGYPISDVHGGDAMQWELSSKKGDKFDDRTYDFVGNIIGKILANEKYDPDDCDIEDMEFWGLLREQLELQGDYAETIESLYSYSEWIDDSDLEIAVKSIISIAIENDEDIVEELNDLVESLNQEKA